MPRFLEGLAGSRFEGAATPATVAVSLRKPLRRPAAVPPAATCKPGASVFDRGALRWIDRKLVEFLTAAPTTPPPRESDLPERKSGPFQR